MEKLKSWLDNYWYHYKWHTLIALVFILTIAIGIGQIAFEKNDYDVYMLYVGGEYIEKEPHEEIIGVIEAAANRAAGVSEASGDSDDEGKDVNFQMLIYQTDERIAKMQEEARAAGEDFVFDFLENNNVLETFMKQLVSGENVIMFLDPELYATAEVNEALYPVEDILGRKVAGMTDSGLGVRLADSGLLEEYPEFAAIPEDSIICFKRVTHAMKLIGRSESQEKHAFQLSVARELFNFDQ